MPDWREGVPELPAQDVLLMRLIRVASQGITAFTEPMLRPYGLTESSFHTLIITLSNGTQGITPSSLCELLGQTRSNMTRILDLLVSEELVYLKTDDRDARRRRVVVLPAGRKLVGTCARLYEPIASAAFNCISDEDKTTLDRILRTVISSMDEAEQMTAMLK